MLPRPISQFNSEYLGLMIYENGILTDPDGDNLTISVVNSDSETVIISPGTSTVREATGVYQYQLPAEGTSVQGNYVATWSWLINGAPRTTQDIYQVVPQMPYWNNLLMNERQAVVDVYARVENSYDSSQGGPYLAELLQSSFNAYEVIARLFQTEALTYFNFEFQPPFNPPFQAGIGAQKTVSPQWYGLIEWGIYVAFLRHLSRSYIEQPIPENVTVPRLNRIDYRDRWRQEWIDEKNMYDKALRQFKRTFLVGSHRSLLVAGGIIPRMIINPSRPVWQYSTSIQTGMF